MAMKHLRATAAHWTADNRILEAGQIGYETDTLKFKFGDGVTAWNSLAYAVGSSGYSGRSGYSGISGISGYSGVSGYSGKSGYSGVSGYSGISGYSGYSGFSGYSGKSGYSGVPGGSNTYVQFNNSGAFGGDSKFVFNSSTGAITLSPTAGTSACFDIFNGGEDAEIRLGYSSGGCIRVGYYAPASLSYIDILGGVFQVSGNGVPLWTLDASGKMGIKALANFPTYSNSSPADGDLWYDGTNLKFRAGATTKTITWT